MLRSRWPLVVVTGAMFWAQGASALGLGAAPQSVLMGVPLEFSIPVQLEPGEVLDAECLAAEVQIGERRQPAFGVRAALDATTDARQPWVRVATLATVDEPVVNVSVSVGCHARVTRRYTVFADPPLTGPGLAPASPEPAPSAATAPAAGAARAAATGAPSASEPTARSVAVAGPAAEAIERGATPAKRSARARKPRAGGPVAAVRAGTPAPAPRLALEAPDPEVLHRAVAAALAEQQASAAAAAALAASAASAAGSRMQALEEQLAALRAEGTLQREQMQLLRQRLAQADTARAWMPWLLAVLAGSVGLALWLGWRLHLARHAQQPQWWAEARQMLADARRDDQVPQPLDIARPQPKAAAKVQRPPPAHERDGPVSAARARASEGDWVQEATTPRPAPLLVEPELPTIAEPVAAAGASRAVSVDELIDLEQQAEFFVVLGQDDAAIDLLMGHLRDSGGTSPLPYLKLLEIYRRQGDREAYERTRTRFNQRFNAYAPDWDTDMQHGRSLDGYPEVMARLERAWPAPIDAMAELEALLFRKDGGEVFDLPAYREVLMLYSLAHEMMGRTGNEPPGVDVLLPLDSHFQLDVTAPMPGASVGERTIVVTPDIALDRPTQFSSVDLELADLEPDTPPKPRTGS